MVTVLSREERSRHRLARALAEVATTGGHYRYSVEAVIRRAGASRSTFYKVFDDYEDAFRHAHAIGRDQLLAALAEADRREMPGDSWGVPAALVRAISAEPALCSLYLLQAPPERGSPRACELVEALSFELAGISVAAGRQPPLGAQLIAGGMVYALAENLSRADTGGRDALAQELDEFCRLMQAVDQRQ